MKIKFNNITEFSPDSEVEFLDSRVIRHLNIFSSAVSIICIAAGITVMYGWLFDIPLLTHIRYQWTSLKVNTAICFILTGISLYITSPGSSRTLVRKSGLLCAVLVFIIAAVTLSQYFINWNPGIDEIILKDTMTDRAVDNPGRMSFTTAVCFILN
ncbi:MAG TPA: hypothetical protein PKG60_11470 [Spirochaetota bacterium]|nr:hypothetical protein [Spirochaetota bacterium]